MIIDYLQIIAPADPRATDKWNTDKAVLELKRMARDLNLPVVVISSLNRDNYKLPINMASFKESGAIEYGSDTLIGLQYSGMDYEQGDTEKTRDVRIRKLMEDNDKAGRAGQFINIQIKVLKNRNGSRGSSAPLMFYPMFNYFEEDQGQPVNDRDNPFVVKL